MVSDLFYIDRDVMSEFENLFFERLSNDEALDKLIREKNVGLENVLSTYVDENWGHSSITIKDELVNHILNGGSLTISSIDLSLRNDSDGVVSVRCGIDFSHKMCFPETINIGDNVNFEYIDKFGLKHDDMIFTHRASVRTMVSDFEVHSTDELLDIIFGIMHKFATKEND